MPCISEKLGTAFMSPELSACNIYSQYKGTGGVKGNGGAGRVSPWKVLLMYCLLLEQRHLAQEWWSSLPRLDLLLRTHRCALPCSPKVYPVEEVPPSPTFGFYMGSLHGKWATSCPAVGWGNRVQSQLLASQRRRCGRSAPCIEDEPLILRVTESGGQGGETMVEGA